jgi:hypothetical protein
MVDANTLISISTQFLLSKEGEKFLSKIEGVNLDKFKELTRKKTLLETDERELTREEKRDLRKLKREVAAEEAKQKLGDEIAKFTPYLKVFTTKGKVFDKVTQEPAVGVEVKPQLAIFPVKLVPRLNVITKEPLTDKDGNVLFKGEEIKDEEKKIKTNSEGEWELTFAVPVVDAIPNTILLPRRNTPSVLYLKDNYAPSYQTIINGNGEVPTEQRLFPILNIDTAAEEAVKEVQQEVNKFLNAQAVGLLDIAEQFLIRLRNTVLKPAKVVQTKLLPLAFKLMTIFGLTKLERQSQEEVRCPDNTVLRNLIKQRNSVVRQINNIYIVITSNLVLAGIFLYLSQFLKGISLQISNLPFPVASPPGVGVPYSVISKLEGIQDLLEQLSDTNKELKKQLIIALVFLIISLIIILRYLKRIDELINQCTDIPMEEINAELLALQEQSEEQGHLVTQNVNGFDLSVEVVDKTKVGELYRRQAIAKNAKGIIILKGEPSFAAEDQILIDELVFYIQSNNLKAD